MLSLFPFSASPLRGCRASAMALVACGLIALASVSGPAAAAPPVEQAVEVVRALYEAHGERYRNGAPPVLNDAAATRLYFADALASDGLQGRLRFDPLYNAQAAQITDLSIGLDPEHRVLRGTALVNASFRNFGQPMRIGYLLRVLPPAGDWQIINVRYDGVGEAGAGAWLLSDLIAATGGAGHDGASATGPNEQVTLFSSGRAEATPAVVPTSADGAGAGAPHRMLVFDASGSMWQQIDGQYKVTIAQQVVSDLLDTLGPDETLGLVAYGHREKGNCADIETLVPPGRNTADAVRAAVAAIKPKGKTPLSAAVMEAARQLRFVEDSATVILISDGRETCDRDPCAVGRELEQAGLDFTAHVIGFDVAAPEDRAQLRCLAENTGGRFLTAANATELSDALTEVAAAPAPAPEPEPEPEPAPADALFEDTFDGTALKPHWTVVNAEPALTDVSEGTLWLAGAYNKRGPRTDKAPNRLILDQPLPDGDWDLVADVSMLVQTGHEAVTVGLFDDADNQTSAYFWVEWHGCGPAPGLTLFSRRGNGDEKPSETKFQVDLFKGPWAGNICYKGGRAHADRVLEVLEREGATLRLSRRGRALTASVEMTIPPRDDAEGATAERVRIETEPVTVLRPSGRVSVWAGQWGETRQREAILRLDRFAIEAVN